MRLNCEFELRLTIEDWVEGEGEGEGSLTLISTNLLSVIEVFGNGKMDIKLDNPLSFDQCSVTSMSLYADFVLQNVPPDQVISTDSGTW